MFLCLQVKPREEETQREKKEINVCIVCTSIMIQAFDCACSSSLWVASHFAW